MARHAHSGHGTVQGRVLGDCCEVLGDRCDLCFRGSASKARRETFVTTETSLGKPSRVPEVPFRGAVCLSMERAPRALLEKASVGHRGVPA
ncbi:hypothetical protein CRG98_022972 [Punica granatum]|uniref:Uncharacterized protein n=1 Tax=Punica granatum TaxID=22663 RepID=A0A2I0JK42_PUNGR|nr:hypothetical protein CRG98_022972 [Punica granatum]